MGILSLIASRNFIAVNKTLIKVFGLDEAIMLGELASEFEYWQEQGRLDEDNFFFSTVENIEDNTGIKEKRQRAILNNLKEKGVVEMKLKGLPAKRYIKINEAQLVSILMNNSGETSGTRTAETAELEQPIGAGNKNNTTKITNKNNNKKASKQNSFNAIILEYANTLDIAIRAEAADLLFEWLKVRKAKRAAMTDRAIKLNIDKLDNLAKQSGLDVCSYLKEVICRGWAAFYPLNNYNAGNGGNKKVGKNGVVLSNEKSDLDDVF